MPWDKVERRNIQSMDELKKEVSALLIGVAEIKIELKNLNANNTTFKDDLNKEIAKLKLSVHGDDHAQDGLIYKVERNTEFRIFWQKFGWIILAGFAGVPCTVVAGIILYMIKGG